MDEDGEQVQARSKYNMARDQRRGQENIEEKIKRLGHTEIFRKLCNFLNKYRKKYYGGLRGSKIIQNSKFLKILGKIFNF